MALKVNEIVKVEVEASDGQVLKEGDAIMLRINRRTPEDVVCRYAGLSNGYFVTTTLDGQHENKYRQASIETCYRIKDVEKVPPQALKEAGKDAAEGAAQDAAAPLLTPGA
ncbi:MAG: hypothetical protein OSJ59_16330 [Lachnospiraceae bacterium]|jgi:hypothetical protein|uniref:hypothetical protein n=1 Tax=Candidatus Merdisoma sp. JLR.KK011 TaxID=3114299 RepID=UPI002FEF88A6|nr:hypothetical protein [Lachnospiraceae bacterium]